MAYSARNVCITPRTFDAGDNKTLADNFRAAGVAPLQCKWIMKSLTERVAASQAGSAAAPPTSPRGLASGRLRKGKQVPRPPLPPLAAAHLH